MNKIIYVILDGMGDLPVDSLGGKSPLEAAVKPNLDMLAKSGKMGRIIPVDKDIPPESDAAVMSLLGYDVHKFYTGRGPIEAMGAGINIRPGELAWRANFGTVNSDWKIQDRRAGRDLSDEEAEELALAVQSEVVLDGAEFVFKHTVSHRAVLVIRDKRGYKLEANLENADPGYRRVGNLSLAVDQPSDKVQRVVALDDSPGARRAAELSNEFLEKSFTVLENHPINKRRKAQGKLPGNFILIRDAGDRLPELPSFHTQHGLNFACLVELPVEIGIAELAELGRIKVSSQGMPTERVYEDWAEHACNAISQYDGVYVHLKGPDIYGHDGDCMGKQDSIEKIDKHFFGTLLEYKQARDALICVTADHSTPCALKAHSADFPPLLLSGNSLQPDGFDTWGESVSIKGSLGIVYAKDLVSLIKTYL
jgi:2,3-bisphosphoglycerate-independent phosphoglycerate mutase